MQVSDQTGCHNWSEVGVAEADFLSERITLASSDLLTVELYLPIHCANCNLCRADC